MSGIIGILLALTMQSHDACKVTRITDPVVVACGTDTYDIPLSQWPADWGSGPRVGVSYYLEQVAQPVSDAEVKRRSRLEQRRWMRTPLQNDFPVRELLKPDN
jgi:hypothetical protein